MLGADINGETGILESITSIPYNEVIDALKEYDTYREIMSETLHGGRASSTAFNEVLAITNNREESKRLLLASLHRVKLTCTYPSDSLRRVKEAYVELERVLSS